MKQRRKKHRNISDRVLYSLIMILGLLVRSISRNVSTAIAHFIGDFIYFIPKTRRQLVEENLALTFPQKTVTEIRIIARQVYRNQAENIIEVLRLPMIKTAEDAARFLDLDGSGILSESIDKKRGAVLVSAHFGNWEMLALGAGLLMTPLNIVVKPLRNMAIDHQINAWRSMHGNKVLYDWQALREGLRALRNGGIVSLLGDQSDHHGVFFTEFLGRRTSVFLGPAYLALKAEVPLFVSTCRRTGDGRYSVDIEQIDLSDLGTTRADAEELARRYTRVLERAIYLHPEEWFWLHNRWRRPES
jgi:KDO2-lipid IV(A) lauroyltransferase